MPSFCLHFSFCFFKRIQHTYGNECSTLFTIRIAAIVYNFSIIITNYWLSDYSFRGNFTVETHLLFIFFLLNVDLCSQSVYLFRSFGLIIFIDSFHLTMRQQFIYQPRKFFSHLNLLYSNQMCCFYLFLSLCLSIAKSVSSICVE